MREMLYRNLNSVDNRKRDLILSELHETEGVTTRVEKRYTYSVKPVSMNAIPKDAPIVSSLPQQWVLFGNTIKARHVFVRKSRDSQDGLEHLTYKVIGSLFATQAGKAYRITYRHVLHMAVAGGDESPKAVLVFLKNKPKQPRS